MLFRLRFQADDARERQAFVENLDLDWETVGEDEKREFGVELVAAGGGFPKRLDEESWFKVDWERVPELVESRRVFLKGGKAYVPGREQLSMVVADFTVKLDKALEVCLCNFREYVEITNCGDRSLPAPCPAWMKMIALRPS